MNKPLLMTRVAAIVPRVSVGNPKRNGEILWTEIQKTSDKGVNIIVCPELCITGYTCGDLFAQKRLREQALEELLILSSKIEKECLAGIVVVGLPLEVHGMLFNVAAVITRGKIVGFVPKMYIPNYKEFYERRWFQSGHNLKHESVIIDKKPVLIGPDLLFRNKSSRNQVILGVEICEDVWTPIPPSSYQALAGANIIVNLSASNDLVGKATYRKSLIENQSARLVCGYVYTSCGVTESTTDLVFGGHALICENGVTLAESDRFVRDGSTIIADIDVEALTHDRLRTGTFGESNDEICDKEFTMVNVETSLEADSSDDLDKYRHIERSPFTSSNPEHQEAIVREVFAIQVHGLATRLEKSGIKHAVLGLSGGLDSTSALLVCLEAFKELGLPKENIHAYTMPGFGTSSQTRGNAEVLAEMAGVSFETINIADGVSQYFKDVNHDGVTQDITYENAQARYRTYLLFGKANQLRAVLVGTGDLSEIALGWCTFNGDHISQYNPNQCVPKTLMRYVIDWVAMNAQDEGFKKILRDIAETPVSPELTKDTGDKISQKTEDKIGPYCLIDFFLYYFIRWGFSPYKIVHLATFAFKGEYDRETITKWLKVFIERFFGAQWKRSVATDGPKVGSVSLSPRGDWRMPSDADVELWLSDLK